MPLARPVPTLEPTTVCFPCSGLGNTADGMDEVFNLWSDRIPRFHHFTTPSTSLLHHSKTPSSNGPRTLAA